MAVLIAYGTIEGQTGKIAKFVQEHLRSSGEDVVVFDTSNTLGEPDLTGVDKIILAASVHERRHPQPFEVFVGSNREFFAKHPTLFLSVSLKAAFESGQEEAQDFADEMKLRTGLEPDNELLVAGAIRSESYDFYASQVLKHVVLAGQKFDPAVRDHEFTDWSALTSCVDNFVQGESG